MNMVNSASQRILLWLSLEATAKLAALTQHNSCTGWVIVTVECALSFVMTKYWIFEGIYMLN